MQRPVKAFYVGSIPTPGAMFHIEIYNEITDNYQSKVIEVILWRFLFRIGFLTNLD